MRALSLLVCMNSSVRILIYKWVYMTMYDYDYVCLYVHARVCNFVSFLGNSSVEDSFSS